MAPSKKFFIFVTILGILALGNVFIFAFALHIFPSYGGFERQILFIKPQGDENVGGYFIMIDNLAPASRNYKIDWMLYSRGSVNLSPSGQSFTCTVPSYLSLNNISLNVTFLEKIDQITTGTGYFLPVHYTDPYPYDDLETSSIAAMYSGAKNPLMATVLYPKNDTDIHQSFPAITTDNFGLTKIGNTDYLYYNERMTDITFPGVNVSFEGQLFFLRQNITYPSSLEYFFLQDAQNLTYEGKSYFSSQSPLKNILITYSNTSQISGAITITDETATPISIFCPFSVILVQLDGVISAFSVSDEVVSFTVTESCSFVISSSSATFSSETDPLRDAAPARVKPAQSEWEFDQGLLTPLSHPYIAFDETELEKLRIKIQDTNKPWNSWYSNYISGVDSYLSINATDIDTESRFVYVERLALKYAVDGGSAYLNKLKEFLFDMNSITYYSQDLERAYAVQAYALAYDIIANNLSTLENTTLFDYLYTHALPLMEMNLYSDNNHRVVDAGALGIAGLALKNTAMINQAIDTLLIYFYTKNPADGGSYEGYSYNAYAMDRMLQFATALKFLYGYNFFNDSQFVACLDFMAETLGPLGMPSLFEDCAFSNRIQEVILIAAAQMNASSPLRAQNYQYIWEQRQANTAYPGSTTYTYLRGGWSSFSRITCYSVNESISAAPYASRKEIWRESAMAFLRSEDTSDSLFVSFSSKTYIQSHTHYDENSFELWAFGAYLVNNPGYPGYGNRYHDWTIETKASNTLLIGGSGQRQDYGEGLIASVSSPYFSMVVGSANSIYNDFGTFENAPEFYYLLVSNFILIGLSGILFYQVTHSKSVLASPPTGVASNVGPLSKLSLLKLAIFHPFQVQDYFYENRAYDSDAKFLNKVIALFLSGLLTLIFIIFIFDMKSIIDYQSQYYEANYSWFFEILPLIEASIITAGAFLTFFGSYIVIKLYGRVNRFLIFQALRKERLDLTKAQINSASRISLIWLFPLILLSAVLFAVTTVPSFKEGIHKIFIGLGSFNLIYHEVLSFFGEIIRNFALIFLFGIPSFIATAEIFSYGTHKITGGILTKRNARKIPAISGTLLLSLSFLLFSILYLGIKLVFSLISIEGSVQ
ncbi:MAG: hypothetical protein EU536_00250 [Promethearchaeota archaeon]|nr:MAG: hypothetical protein EU536_00250 [Candidatus Lokiarchaeota archaeon]